MKLVVLILSTALLAGTARAQAPNDPAIEACRSTGLIALQERSPTVKDLIFDMETLALSTANTKVEDVPIRMVIMGEAYLERKKRAGKLSCAIRDASGETGEEAHQKYRSIVGSLIANGRFPATLRAAVPELRASRQKVSFTPHQNLIACSASRLRS